MRGYPPTLSVDSSRAAIRLVVSFFCIGNYHGKCYVNIVRPFRFNSVHSVLHMSMVMQGHIYYPEATLDKKSIPRELL